MSRKITLVLFSIYLILFYNIGFAANRLPVLVSIAPQKYFVQQIGKDLVDIQVMVQPGASPHTYEPKPKQMAGLSGAQIYFAIGVPFESVWLKKMASVNPKIKIIYTDHDIEKLPMTARHHHEAEDNSLKGYLANEDEHNQRQGEEPDEDRRHLAGTDSHGLRDPHIWLSPPLVMVQARLIRDALQEIDPQHHEAYAGNYSAFISQIVELDNEIKHIFAGKKNLEFMVFHPSWGYFAHAYQLKQIPIEIEGKNPKPAELKALIKYAKKKEIKVIFVQPQFSTKSAALIAREIGGEVVAADPLAENWLTNLGMVADKFKAALR